MGYTMATVKELIKLESEIHIVHWNKNRKAPLKFKSTSNLNLYNRSDYTKKDLRHLSSKIQPDLVVISGCN